MPLTGAITLVFGVGTVTLFAGALAPAAGLLFAIWLDKRRRLKCGSVSGQHLSEANDVTVALELERLWEQGTTRLIWAMFWSALSGLTVALLAKAFTLPLPLGLSLMFAAFLAAIALPGPIYAVGAYRAIKQAKCLINALPA